MESTEIVEQSTITFDKTGEYVKNSDAKVKFAIGEKIPIMLDGVVKGYLNVNWVQKLGIWDLNNTKAVKNGIKSSYTMNFNVDFSESFYGQKQKTISIYPYLIRNNGKVVGEPCCVGWSGFEQTVELYDKSNSGNCEVGLQPEIKNYTKKTNLVLKITDDAGNVYDDVYLSMKYLTKAEKGPSLLTDNKAAIIKCINGGKFSLKMRYVYKENHYEYKNKNSDISPYFDFSYTIKYHSKPTNSKKDAIFDSNNGNKLQTKFVSYLTSDVDGTKLYDENPYAVHNLYNNKEQYEEYVTTKFKSIAVGKSKKIISNRKLDKGSATPTYVRICFEFPEEVQARTLEQMKNFNGRFVVFQEMITDRALGEYNYAE